VNNERVRELLEAVAGGEVTVTRAFEQLAWLPSEAVGDAGGSPFARLDHHRTLRQGVPEVVFAEGKTPEQTLRICERLHQRNGGFLVTRADEPTRALLHTSFPAADVNDLARTVVMGAPAGALAPDSHIAVVSAGTSDLPIAEEAVVTATAFGARVTRTYDVGVAGLHRLLDAADTLRGAGVIIVVAGMEGALPSVVGGLVAQPVIAVPTSVGYGAAFGGLAALLGMLNSCAAGVTVVNIDNGFGAACAATRILRTLAHTS
jgi:hypothetical protein